MAQLSARSNKVRKKDICALMKTRAFRTLDKRWLLSFTSLPLGETRVREQVAENRFFRNLLAARRQVGSRNVAVALGDHCGDRGRIDVGGGGRLVLAPVLQRQHRAEDRK